MEASVTTLPIAGGASTDIDTNVSHTALAAGGTQANRPNAVPTDLNQIANGQQSATASNPAIDHEANLETTKPPNPTRHPNPIYLIWGSKGWIATLLHSYLTSLPSPPTVHGTTARLEDRTAVLAELEKYKPTHVLHCAGVTGRPNVDWCEDHREETIRSNVIGTLNLVDCCYLKGIHVTVFATGCIYQYSSTHPQGSGKGFIETDRPNFDESFYSHTKGLTEILLSTYTTSNCLILRLRMPVSDDLHPRSFVTKITKYDRVVDIPNSNTVLHDLLPCAILLAEHNELGVFNFTNPGAISHNEVLSLYREIVNPAFSWKNFGLEEQSKVIKAGRSNCQLNSDKLVAKIIALGGPVLPEVHQAYRMCFERMSKSIDH